MRTVVLEKTLASLLDCKEIQSVNPKGNHSWIFIGSTDAEAETTLLWPLDLKNQLIGKDPDAGKDWRQEEKGTTEDEIVGCHHRLNGHEFEHASGVSDGQGNLACSSPRGGKELDTTEWLNWTESMRANNVTPTPAAHFLSPSWHLAPSILLTWRDESPELCSWLGAPSHPPPGLDLT